MDNEAINLYKLNRRALEYRNSREYFVGQRICLYINLIKQLHFLTMFKQIFEDIYRVIFKKKRNPVVTELDLTREIKIPKMVVYTSVFGNYDKIVEPLYKDPNCDYFIITDQEVPADSIWKKYDDFKFPEGVDTPFLKNRYVKFMPHKIFGNYRYSLYLDGNIQIVSAVSAYVVNFNSRVGIGMHRHPSNINLYEEVKYNVRLKKINKKEAVSILERYKTVHMPRNFGMLECNVILRDHTVSDCYRIMDSWWNEVLNGVKRDQLYFTLVLFELGYKVDDIYILGDNINSNPMFIREKHK